MAFKDFGSRFMAGIASLFVEGQGKKLTILVATSGDTGSAVAAGFYQVPNIDVILLYPEGKVSHLQEKQLTTMGGNITAIEVKGSFDDCQKLVKMAFVDDKLKQKLRLTSANSINIARLLPQIFYYFYGYSRLAKGNNPIVFSVPSGNFGNLTAGLMAKKMGLPVGKFIAATNANDTVPRYLASGLFAPKPSIKTLSNSMDVGNPSNFDRILDLYDYNLETILADVYAAAFSDKKTRQAISHVYYKYQYLLDPHGAVAYLGLKKYLQEENPKAQGIFLATAHPAKFAEIVEPIIMQKIKMPANLDKVLTKKKKNAVTIPNKFSSFKSLLLDL